MPTPQERIGEIVSTLYWHAHETGVQKNMPDNEISISQALSALRAVIEGEEIKGDIKGFGSRSAKHTYKTGYNRAISHISDLFKGEVKKEYL